MSKIKRLMIVAGGTGGHIFPGIVIAKKFIKSGRFVKWIGSFNRLEYTLIPKHNIDVDFIYIPSLLEGNFLCLFNNFFIFWKIIYNICLIIKKWKPDIVLGFGGYISFCGIFSAWLCRVLTIIHEQNAVVGKSNRYLYYISNKVIQAFPNTFSDSNVVTVGNPIRDELLSISNPYIRLFNRTGIINILVIGGSQGSYIINDVILKVVKNINNDNFSFLHQVGINNYYNFKKNNKNLRIKNYIFVDFINDMKFAYSWADLIICRSGALTVSEISKIGLAAIFIPFIHKDKQQYFNAKFLVDVGAAIMIEECNLNCNILKKNILNLNRNKLFIMSKLSYLSRIKNSNYKFLKEILSI